MLCEFHLNRTIQLRKTPRKNKDKDGSRKNLRVTMMMVLIMDTLGSQNRDGNGEKNC